jgi:hypothetical protein
LPDLLAGSKAFLTDVKALLIDAETLPIGVMVSLTAVRRCPTQQPALL